ncbi:SRPBCC family protein [Cyanobacteria bacterium FACHB-DQ100]|uniref:SRPBCC family protein n=1 Tax=unclassified Leptolyngbya TaxID=2650499 RepID=UPI00168034FB|nr:SRPBCC family protein [Leptolyngbya sp. FACHB-17]MBD1823345.1 SRPBCC family protein [Cyanobacteria bacterium FACHB-DQ100]MBD2083235.1 SRPBCC family protein [Leptolyngbya sp. FACHB-17]
METESNKTINSSESQPPSLTDTEKWASIVGGSAMVLFGLQKRSLRGVLTAIAGGSLAYHGATAEKSLTDKVSDAVGLNKAMKVEKTVTINKPAEELYSYWRNFENLPTFMKHVKSITVSEGGKRSHWVANAPLGQEVEWDADLIKDEPNHLIAWASIEGADVDNSGFVRFTPAPGDRGTEVKVVMEYEIAGGRLTAALAKLFGEEPEQQVGDELRRFKQLMEAGEIATTEGQPRCHG